MPTDPAETPAHPATLPLSRQVADGYLTAATLGLAELPPFHFDMTVSVGGITMIQEGNLQVRLSTMEMGVALSSSSEGREALAFLARHYLGMRDKE